MEKRLQNLIGILDKRKLGAFLITDRNNIRYLTGFRGEDCALVISKNQNFIITDFRFLEEVNSSEIIKKYFHVELRKKLFSDSVKQIYKRLKFKTLAFESKRLPYKSYVELKRLLSGVMLIAEEALLEKLRLVKDAAEIESIKKAISISKSAYKEISEHIMPGLTESYLAARLDYTARRLGSSAPPFETIVACDSNSSKPHAESGDTKIRKNSIVLIDFGAKVNGYNSDLTRVVVLGKIDADFKKIYNIVELAQKKAIESIRPGVPIYKIDAIARNYIKDKGFGKFFGHALGHGIGLSVHEDPVINTFNKNSFSEGMVVTIEPGIYIPGYAGVRIEDMVLVTKKGCEVLSR